MTRLVYKMTEMEIVSHCFRPFRVPYEKSLPYVLCSNT